MKTTIIVTLVCILIILGCKKESETHTDNPQTDPNATSFDKYLILGWWTSDVSRNGVGEYKRRYFGADSTMIIDMSNFGLGTASADWWWLKKDTFYAQGLGSSRAVVLKLTADSLHINWLDFSRILYYYK